MWPEIESYDNLHGSRVFRTQVGEWFVSAVEPYPKGPLPELLVRINEKDGEERFGDELNARYVRAELEDGEEVVDTFARRLAKVRPEDVFSDEEQADQEAMRILLEEMRK